MAGREGRPDIAQWLCFNPRAQVGHVPDSKFDSLNSNWFCWEGGEGEGWTIASIHNILGGRIDSLRWTCIDRFRRQENSTGRSSAFYSRLSKMEWIFFRLLRSRLEESWILAVFWWWQNGGGGHVDHLHCVEFYQDWHLYCKAKFRGRTREGLNRHSSAWIWV